MRCPPRTVAWLLGLLVACVPPASLAAQPLAANAGWHAFDVDEALAQDGGLGWIDIADGSALAFTFSVPEGQRAWLDVVDAGFAGDRFDIRIRGRVRGTTSVAGTGDDIGVGLDFDAAWADARYSRATFRLVPGTWTVGGDLHSSVLVEGVPLNATVGAVRLTVSPVPEPASALLTLAGLAVVGAATRTRRAPGDPSPAVERIRP